MMLFLFALCDCRTEAYVSHNPIFDKVSGVHLDQRFITAEMVEAMTYEIKKDEPDFRGFEGDMSSFLYAYTSCMDELCESGLTPKGTTLVHYML